jgi:hypothetical protein
MDIASIAQQCQGAHKDKDGWRAKCPVHQGHSDTSLHLWEEGETFHVHCFAGCAPADILRVLDVERPTKRRDVYEAIYTYHDAQGHGVYQVVRLPKKQFRQRRPDPVQPGAWIWDMKGVSRLLYRLPEVLQAVTMKQPVYLVEGEKDVETLRRLGVVATCNVGGANKWDDNYNESLQDAEVVVLPDNDAPGQQHARLLAARLRGIVRRLTIVHLPDLPDKGDVSDWVTAGHGITDLQALTLTTHPSIEAPHLIITKLADVEPEAVAWLWEPYIACNKLTFLEGDPGQGKTWLMLAIAAAITRGYHLPDQDGRVGVPHHEAGHVIYITAEDGIADTLRPRAEKAGADLSKLFVVEGWSAGGNIEPFSFQHLSLLADVIHDMQARMVILDPIQAFLGGKVDMFRANEVRPFMAQLGRLAGVHRCAIIAIRHLTKGTGKAMYRGQGSIDFTAAARSVLVVGESLEDESKRILAQSKNSLTEKGASLVYQITNEGFFWCGTTQINADELLSNQPQKHQHQRQAVADWLLDLLRHGAKPATLIYDEGSAQGMAKRTIDRAKASLHVLTYKQNSRSYWKLPGIARSWEGEDRDDLPF